MAEEIGFISVSYYDQTCSVIPSAIRLNRLYWILSPYRLIVGQFNSIRKKNSEAARVLSKAFKEELLLYGIIYAEKPINV